MSIEIKAVPKKIINDLTGKVFGKWTVLGYAGSSAGLGFKGKGSYWVCKCCCGCEKEVAIFAGNLTRGFSKSCGNLEGRKNNPSYVNWKQMKSRCYISNDKNYHRYGARGITVCDEWMNDFRSFDSDMGPKPSSKHSVDRIDNNGNYGPGNCKWSTALEQGRNTRKNKTITINGITRCYSEWEQFTGMPESTVSQRINKLGWCDECAVAQPKGGTCKHKKLNKKE